MKFALCCLAIIGCASAQFSTAAQTAIVQAHNDLRSSIAQGTFSAAGAQQPSAANMLKMQWDNTIGASAQQYANTCPTGHSGAPDLGENLYWEWTPATVISLDSYGVAASKAWAQEFQDSGLSYLTMDQALFDSGIGHASQMAWAQTNLIGCGVTNCGPDPTVDNMNKIAVVCQYKPAGNMFGSDIWQKGNTCSSCPSGSTCETSSGLCA